jgi:hypothetical protein
MNLDHYLKRQHLTSEKCAALQVLPAYEPHVLLQSRMEHDGANTSKFIATWKDNMDWDWLQG